MSGSVLRTATSPTGAPRADPALLFDHVIDGLTDIAERMAAAWAAPINIRKRIPRDGTVSAGMFRLPPLSEKKNSSIRSTGCYAAAIP